MRLAFIRPYHGTNVAMDSGAEWGAVYETSGAQPDLALVNAVSLVASSGEHVAVVDANAERLALENAMQAVTHADVVVLRAALPTVNEDLEAARQIKAGLPESTLLLSGHVVSTLEPWIEERCLWVDGIVCGELEGAVQTLRTGMPLRTGGSRLLRIAGPQLDLNELSVPQYELFPYQLYTTEDGRRLAYAMTSRGCNYPCSYCPYIEMYGRVRSRDLSLVVEDLRHLAELGVEVIQFRDALFTYDRRRAMDLMARLEREQLPLHWWCETRVDRLDAELVQAMAGAGCEMIAFGVEAASEEVLRGVQRRVARTHTEVRELNRVMRDAGVLSQGMFILGLPGDTRESVRATIDLALGLDLDGAQFNVFTPYPDSDLWDELGERPQEVTPELFLKGKSHMTVAHEEMSVEELEEAAELARKLFSVQTLRRRARAGAVADGG